MADHIDFEFICSHSVPLGHGLPEWDHGGPYKGRATRSFIEEVRGPLRPGETLQQAFDDDVVQTAKSAAMDKLKRANGIYDPPMIVDVADVPAI